MNSLIRPMSKVIDINHKRTKEEIEQGRKNLEASLERMWKIKKLQHKVRYGC